MCSYLIANIFTSEAQENRYYKDSLGVDLNTVIQDNFLGIGSVYHGFAYMPESEAHGTNDAFRKIEFDRVSKSGIKIARTCMAVTGECQCGAKSMIGTPPK